MSTSQKHDWLQDKIYNDSKLVQINPNTVISKEKEKTLLYKGHPLVVPDICFHTSTAMHLLEIKSHNSMMLYNKGMYQLEKMLFWAEFNGLPQPDAKLVMPNYTIQRSDNWIDMLYDLKYYCLGDSFNTPRYFHQN